MFVPTYEHSKEVFVNMFSKCHDCIDGYHCAGWNKTCTCFCRGYAIPTKRSHLNE